MVHCSTNGQLSYLGEVSVLGVVISPNYGTLFYQWLVIIIGEVSVLGVFILPNYGTLFYQWLVIIIGEVSVLGVFIVPKYGILFYQWSVTYLGEVSGLGHFKLQQSFYATTQLLKSYLTVKLIKFLERHSVNKLPCKKLGFVSVMERKL